MVYMVAYWTKWTRKPKTYKIYNMINFAQCTEHHFRRMRCAISAMPVAIAASRIGNVFYTRTPAGWLLRMICFISAYTSGGRIFRIIAFLLWAHACCGPLCQCDANMGRWDKNQTNTGTAHVLGIVWHRQNIRFFGRNKFRDSCENRQARHRNGHRLIDHGRCIAHYHAIPSLCWGGEIQNNNNALWPIREMIDSTYPPDKIKDMWESVGVCAECRSHRISFRFSLKSIILSLVLNNLLFVCIMCGRH